MSFVTRWEPISIFMVGWHLEEYGFVRVNGKEVETFNQDNMTVSFVDGTVTTFSDDIRIGDIKCEVRITTWT